VPNYLSPGVYIEEVSSGPRPIEAVGTSTAAFLGVASNPDAPVHDAIAIGNWNQFVRVFCREDAPRDDAPIDHLANAVYGFFGNGGRRCFVVNVGKGGSIAGTVKKGRRQGIAVLEEVDEVAIVAAPGYADPASYEVVFGHCEKMRDRVAIVDGPEVVERIEQLVKVGTASVPGGPGAPGGPAPGDVGLRPPNSNFGILYHPWISVMDPFTPMRLVNVPPSGHLAGIYARTDATRGVHKAPANERVVGALNVAYRVTREEQELLNPAGVNCIRFFPESGIRVWGCRTLGDADWRYVPIRRFFNMVEESIVRATQWAVFEPNDPTLWKSLIRDVRAFLTRLWRDGALMGRRPEDAFFVKCDEENNPPEVIDAGQLVIEVGVAPVKPAEFIIFRIGQSAAGAKVEAEAHA
jgi:phage tail sheath protein FI